MIDVLIIDEETGKETKTKLPQIPRKKDSIGIWFNYDYYSCEVLSICYETKSDNTFLHVEIMVLADKC